MVPLTPSRRLSQPVPNDMVDLSPFRVAFAAAKAKDRQEVRVPSIFAKNDGSNNYLLITVGIRLLVCSFGPVPVAAPRDARPASSRLRKGFQSRDESVERTEEPMEGCCWGCGAAQG